MWYTYTGQPVYYDDLHLIWSDKTGVHYMIHYVVKLCVSVVCVCVCVCVCVVCVCVLCVVCVCVSVVCVCCVCVL